MEKRSNAHVSRSISSSWSHGECTAASSGEATCRTLNISQTAAYDPNAVRHARIELQWRLQDLAESVACCPDTTDEDADWYLDAARRIFGNSLQQKGGGNAET